MRKRIKRMNILLIAFSIIFTLLIGKMFYIQIIRHEDFADATAGQYVIPFEMIEHENQNEAIYFENADDTKAGYYYIVHRRQCGMRLTRTMYLIHGEPIGTKGKDYVIYRAGIYDKGINRILRKKFYAYAFCLEQKIENADYNLVGNGYGAPIQGIGLKSAGKVH